MEGGGRRVMSLRSEGGVCGWSKGSRKERKERGIRLIDVVDGEMYDNVSGDDDGGGTGGDNGR